MLGDGRWVDEAPAEGTAELAAGREDDTQADTGRTRVEGSVGHGADAVPSESKGEIPARLARRAVALG